jgi:hypothetical protein
MNLPIETPIIMLGKTAAASHRSLIAISPKAANKASPYTPLTRKIMFNVARKT